MYSGRFFQYRLSWKDVIVLAKKQMQSVTKKRAALAETLMSLGKKKC